MEDFQDDEMNTGQVGVAVINYAKRSILMTEGPPHSSSQLLPYYKSKEWLAKRIKQYPTIFPPKRSERLAGIVADLMGDGHLQAFSRWRIDYTSKYVHELKRFDKEIFDLFGIMGRIRRCTSNQYGETYIYSVNNKLLAVSLYLSGVPPGAKVLTRFKIPEWILFEKAYFRTFIRRLFSCEGYIDTDAVAIDMAKSVELLEEGLEFFRQIKEYLYKYWKIVTTNPFVLSRKNIRKDDIVTHMIRLKIKRKESVKRFFENVGFDEKRKQKRLQQIIASYKIKNGGGQI